MLVHVCLHGWRKWSALSLLVDGFLSVAWRLLLVWIAGLPFRDDISGMRMLHQEQLGSLHGDK